MFSGSLFANWIAAVRAASRSNVLCALLRSILRKTKSRPVSASKRAPWMVASSPPRVPIATCSGSRSGAAAGRMAFIAA